MWGLWGQSGIFLAGHTYDVGVMVIFLFEMVFMDTALTIVTGACAERWKFLAFTVSSIIMGALTYPLYGNWAWGGGWLSQLGTNVGLGKGYCDFAGSGVVHAVGGITALAVCMIIGPRIGKYNRDGSSNPILGHDVSAVLIGCFILAFGWFGFNPGSTLGASANGNLRIGSIAVNTMLAGCTGTMGAILYMWSLKGKPDYSMSGNGLLAGLVAITAPSGFVSTFGAAVIGAVAGVLVCLSCAFFENALKVDDPVGAISVHGTNGLWGVISIGLFADGTSNYGGSWNGVTGSSQACSTAAMPASWSPSSWVSPRWSASFSPSAWSSTWQSSSSSDIECRRKRNSRDLIFRRWGSSGIPTLCSSRSPRFCWVKPKKLS